MDKQSKRWQSNERLLEERQEVIETARQAFAERPWDQTTQRACAYLLSHSLQGTGKHLACGALQGAA